VSSNASANVHSDARTSLLHRLRKHSVNFSAIKGMNDVGREGSVGNKDGADGNEGEEGDQSRTSSYSDILNNEGLGLNNRVSSNSYNTQTIK